MLGEAAHPFHAWKVLRHHAGNPEILLLPFCGYSMPDDFCRKRFEGLAGHRNPLIERLVVVAGRIRDP
jgi:hypothetical protein